MMFNWLWRLKAVTVCYLSLNLFPVQDIHYLICPADHHFIKKWFSFPAPRVSCWYRSVGGGFRGGGGGGAVYWILEMFWSVIS